MPITKKAISKGVLVWWSRSYDFDCPGVITNVIKTTFRVLTFDDFKESGDLQIEDIGQGSLASSEMRLCSVSEVETYFKKRASEISVYLATLMEKVTVLEKNKERYESPDVEGLIRGLMYGSKAQTKIVPEA
jgi:hypothetical protein